MKKNILYFISLLACITTFAQVSVIDSLEGFNISDVTLHAQSNNLNAIETAVYEAKQQRAFINARFHLITSQIASLYSIPSNPLSPQSGQNLDFEIGNFSGWTITSGLNQQSVIMAGCCNNNNGQAYIINGGTDIVNNKNLNSPLGGSSVARLNSDTSHFQAATRLINTFSVTATQNVLNIAYMAVLEQCQHNCADNSYINVCIYDSQNNIVRRQFVQANEGYSYCTGSNSADLFTYNYGLGSYFSSPWHILNFDFSANTGSVYRIELTAAACALGGHAGYAYFDATLTQSNTSPAIALVNGNPTPVTSQNQVIPICSGLPQYTLTAPAGATSYSWTGAGVNGLHTQTVIVNAGTGYTVSYNRPSVWGNTTNVIFNQSYYPPLNITYASDSICSGYTGSINVSGAYIYTWLPNNLVTPTYGPSTLTLTVPNTTTTYTIIGETNGCQSTIYHTMHVLPSPVLSFTGNNICVNTTTTLQVLGASSYTWSGVPGPSTMVITPSSSYTYYVSGENANGCISTVTVPVNCSNTFLSMYPPPKVCYGDSLFINPSGATTYSLNGVYIPSGIRIKPLVNTTYTLSATNACGTLFLPFTATVTPKPVVSITGNTSLCYAASTTLTAHGATSYTWSPTFSNATSLAITNNTVSQVYSLSGITNGCYGFATTTITVGPAPTLTISAFPQHNICLGQTATLTVVGASSYTWTGGQTTNTISVTPASTGYPSYNVVTTNSLGCNSATHITLDVSTTTPTISTYMGNTSNICNGGSASFQMMGALSYINENTNTIVFSPVTVSPSVTTTYTITSNSGCGASSATVQVNVTPVSTISIAGPDSACVGSVATYTAFGASSYIWDNAVSSPSTYSVICNASRTVTLTGVGSCLSGSLTKTLSAKAVPAIAISGAINNCSTSSTTLTASGAVTYTWSTGFTGNPLVLNFPGANSYSVSGTSNGCTANQSINIYDLTAPPSVYYVGLPYNSCTNVSQPTQIQMLPQGGVLTVNGSAGTGTIPSSAGTYSLSYIYSNLYGCTTMSNTNVQVNQSPVVTTSVVSRGLCIGSGTDLLAFGAPTYSWSNSSTTSSISITPTISTTYTVTGTNANNCSSTQTVAVTVNQTCQDVWPGDANSDGTADNFDVLELGLHFTQTGPPRTSTSNSWQSYVANNWAGTISNGKNVNHSDCNGDGTINNNDTLAIYTNYGLTHAFKQIEETTTNPQLSIVPDQTVVDKGAWGSSSVFLGEASAPVTNINGLAFTLTFDQTLLDANSFYVEYPSSFLNASNQNLKFSKPDFINGKLYTATTHTITGNVSGNGKIAVIHYKIKSTLATDEIFNIGITQAKQSNAAGALTPLTAGTATIAAIGASVGMDELSNGNNIGIYPNPANTSLTIQSNTSLQKIELLSITGQIIFTEKTFGNQHQLNLGDLANGVYFVVVYDAGQKVTRRKIVVQH